MFRRKDAKRCKDISGMNQILLDLKPHRYQGELYINQLMDVTELVKYIKEMKNTQHKITYFHAFSTAIGKVIYNRPLLNRFISNRHVYEHNDVSLSFVMKINFDDKSEEIMVVMPIEKDDTLFTISDKIASKVASVRKQDDKGTGANDAIQVLGKLPNIIRVPIVGIFKSFARHGLLPKSLIKDNLYYSSMLLSDVGSLHCGGIYHNVTDFGTCSGIITIGEVKEEKVGKDTKYYCEFGITMDERIGDGFYFIKSIHLLQYLLNNPKLLEEEASKKVDMKKDY